MSKDEFDYEEGSVVILTDENGNDLKLEFLDSIAYRGSEYAVMIPPETDDDSDEPADVIILKVESNNDGTEGYTVVDDEKALNEVFAIFKQRYKDYFDFE